MSFLDQFKINTYDKLQRLDLGVLRMSGMMIDTQITQKALSDAWQAIKKKKKFPELCFSQAAFLAYAGNELDIFQTGNTYISKSPVPINRDQKDSVKVASMEDIFHLAPGLLKFRSRYNPDGDEIDYSGQRHQGFKPLDLTAELIVEAGTEYLYHINPKDKNLLSIDCMAELVCYTSDHYNFHTNTEYTYSLY